MADITYNMNQEDQTILSKRVGHDLSSMKVDELQPEEVCPTPPSRGKISTSENLTELLQHVRDNDGTLIELDLTQLALDNVKLDESGGVLVARVLQLNRSVKRLIVPDHGIGNRGANAIADMLRVNHTVEYIDLYGNDIDDEGCISIANALYGHESLRELLLWGNRITDKGAIALAQALQSNRTITYVSLVDNQIDESGASALVNAVELNPRLATINLANNNVPASVMTRLNAALATNKLVQLKIIHTEDDEEEEVTETRRSSISRGGLSRNQNPSSRHADHFEDENTDDERSGSDTDSRTEDDDGSIWI